MKPGTYNLIRTTVYGALSILHTTSAEIAGRDVDRNRRVVPVIGIWLRCSGKYRRRGGSICNDLECGWRVAQVLIVVAIHIFATETRGIGVLKIPAVLRR